MYIKIKKIPWHRRIIGAFVSSFYALAMGIFTILMTPVVFIQTLMTKEVVSVDTKKLQELGEAPYPPTEDGIHPDAREDWLKDHDELYGEK